jgi:hypothetical protein
MKLIGKYGEILFDNNRGVAVIASPILQAKYGDYVEFEAKDLEKWIGKLKIHSTEDGRIGFGQWN